HEWTVSPSLRFQGFQQFANRFRSTMEDKSIVEVKDLQPTERVRRPPAHMPDLPLELSREKITQISPKNFFKFLKVAIIAQAAGKLPLTVLFPISKETLEGVP